MDDLTLNAYDSASSAYATEWEEQPTPTDLRLLIERFFAPGPTADVGCGSGRETAWLNENGFPAVGYDASAGLLEEARRRHPKLPFKQSALPALEGIPSATFANVLCETVVMHLDSASIAAAVERLLDILEPGGALYLSWRVTEDADRRDDGGRLYTAFPASLVTDALAGAAILYDRQVRSASSGAVVHRIVARRPQARRATVTLT
jgi:SAM-dependent methyltransferase